MDSFFDKIAGRFKAEEVIKANSEAEAKELESAKNKVADLEKAVGDMRRLSLKAVETNEATTQLVASAIEKIEEIRSEGGNVDSEELRKISEELLLLRETIEASFKASSEEAHKENVRVYRNVQAAVIEELKQQSEAIAIQHNHIERRIRGIKPCAIISLVFSGVSLAVIVSAVVYWFITVGF